MSLQHPCLPKPPGGWGAPGGRLHCCLHPRPAGTPGLSSVGGGNRRAPRTTGCDLQQVVPRLARLLSPQPGKSWAVVSPSFFQCCLEHRDCDEGNSSKLGDSALSCQRAGLRVGAPGLAPWLACSRAEAALLGFRRLLRGYERLRACWALPSIMG